MQHTQQCRSTALNTVVFECELQGVGYVWHNDADVPGGADVTIAAWSVGSGQALADEWLRDGTTDA